MIMSQAMRKLLIDCRKSHASLYIDSLNVLLSLCVGNFDHSSCTGRTAALLGWSPMTVIIIYSVGKILT